MMKDEIATKNRNKDWWKGCAAAGCITLIVLFVCGGCMVGTLVKLAPIFNSFDPDGAMARITEIVSSDPAYNGEKIVMGRTTVDGYLIKRVNDMGIEFTIGGKPYYANCTSGASAIVCQIYRSGIYGSNAK